MDSNLNNAFSEIWKKLTSAEKDNPFKNITVCNYTADDINAYTVVLREAYLDDRTLVFYTDVRSKKVDEIQRDNRLTVVAYSHDERLQIILKGKAVIHHHNEIAKQYWRKNGFKGRKSYLAHPAPSTTIDEPADGLAYLNTDIFEDTDIAGYDNFAVVKLNIEYLEYVKLNREGNRRAKFELDIVSNSWQGRWLIP